MDLPRLRRSGIVTWVRENWHDRFGQKGFGHGSIMMPDGL